MTRIAVITDSTGYLPPKLIDQYGIYVVPVYILWGSQKFRDGVDITTTEFHRRLREDPVHPTTTQPNPDDFLRIYEQLAVEHDAIIAVLISSELSGTVNSAQIAASDFNRVPLCIVDSHLTTMGLGFTVLAAARAAAQGKSLEEVEEAARAAALRVKVMFAVDTLKYLHRGGRIGGASRMLGTALSIKPILHLNEGRVDALESVRTKAKATKRMLDLAAQYADSRPVQAAVIHADALEEAEILRSKVAERLICKELYVADLSPAISFHTGPGTLGLVVCQDGLKEDV